MTFPVFLDEHVDPELAQRLIRIDCDVITTRDAGRASRSFSDEEQLEFATGQGRALFTYDTRDYDRLARAWMAFGKHHAGIIIGQQKPVGDLYEGFVFLFDYYPHGIPDIFLRLPTRQP